MSRIAAAHQYRTLFDLFESYIPAGARILDWGSGCAIFSFALATMGYTVNAADFVVPLMREFIEEQTGSRFSFSQLDDPVSLPYASQTFDVVLSVAVLEHVRETDGDELSSLLEIRRVLKPDGVFLCVHFPNKYSWIEAVVRHLNQPALYTHPYRYTRKDIASLAKRAGFCTETIRSYGIIPRNPLSKLPPRVGDSKAFVKLIDRIDDILGSPFWRLVSEPRMGRKAVCLFPLEKKKPAVHSRLNSEERRCASFAARTECCARNARPSRRRRACFARETDRLR